MIPFNTLLLGGYNVLRIALWRVCGRRIISGFWQRISPKASVKAVDRSSITLGRGLEIFSGCDIQAHGHGHISIGAGTFMNRYCMISARNDVKIGSGCMFGPGVKIFDNNHRFSAESGVSHALKSAPIHIGNNCWLASDVVVLKGTVIGNNCVIGAGCVVSGVIPDGSLVRRRQDLEITVINK